MSKPLIVPYLPVARFSKMLTSMSVSVRLIAFLSQNEKQSFLGRLQQAETQNRKLAISSYKSFANTPIEKTMKGIVKRFRQSKVRVEKETDILIDEKIREYSKKFAYQGNNSVDAVPIYFEENTKIILLSPRSSLISITENNEFEI